jgi:hypothetical protein
MLDDHVDRECPTSLLAIDSWFIAPRFIEPHHDIFPV